MAIYQKESRLYSSTRIFDNAHKKLSADSDTLNLELKRYLLYLFIDF